MRQLIYIPHPAEHSWASAELRIMPDNIVYFTKLDKISTWYKKSEHNAVKVLKCLYEQYFKNKTQPEVIYDYDKFLLEQMKG